MAAAGAPWQLECEKVEQRCGYLLTSGQWSDCTFTLGSENNQEVIQAHKLVLAMASPVFEAMFYGGLSERHDPIVPILDVQPEAFRVLLQYIYTGNINLDSFDMTCDLWYGAKKYMLPHLVKQCTSYICSVVGPTNACRAYELAHLFEEKTVMDKCIQIIRTNTKEVLNDSSFVDVELNTLITVCSLDELNVENELDLFHAVARYAEAEQRRQGQISPHVEGGPSSEEPSIRGALQKIRFLSLSPAQFAEGPARSNLLTKDETLAVILNIASKDSAAVPMPTGFSECRKQRQPRSELQKADQCFKAGSLDHTINALKCGNPSQVEKAAGAASYFMCHSKPLEIQQALDKGILDALVPALTEGSVECKMNAANSIHWFCTRGSSAQLGVLAASAALQPCCRLLTAGGYTCYYALHGLTKLLQRVELNTKFDLIRKLQALGISKLLIPLQQYLDNGNGESRQLASNLKLYYFNNDR